jgi:hypothetical protein
MNVLIEKQRYIIDFTVSSLMRRKVKNIGLLVLYTLIVFILASTHWANRFNKCSWVTVYLPI